MAKKAYIGVNGVARKIKKGYVGVETDVPIYEEKTGTVTITASNLSEYFTVSNDFYYFAGSGSTFTSNNKGVNGSTAMSEWTAKKDMSAVSFSYSVSSESNFDKLTIVVKGTVVANGISGTVSSTWSGSLSAGDTISLTFYKDSSVAGGNDCGTLSAMSITTTVKTQVGSERKNLAREIKKAFIGIAGVARQCWSNRGVVFDTTGVYYPYTISTTHKSIKFVSGKGFVNSDTYNDSFNGYVTMELNVKAGETVSVVVSRIYNEYNIGTMSAYFGFSNGTTFNISTYPEQYTYTNTATTLTLTANADYKYVVIGNWSGSSAGGEHTNEYSQMTFV